jgi:hypothetical protein
MATYTTIIASILRETKKINLIYSREGDGRITSAIQEKEYLDLLESGLKNDPTISVTRPPHRHWYDIRINNIPINLKLSTGGTDNAFNKVAILYTMFGKEDKRNMNFNAFFKEVRSGVKKTVRDPMTEYHYLVVNKEDGSVLLKSILDIHTFKSNPCNDLQINWTNEFKHIDYMIKDKDFHPKMIDILKVVQRSVQQSIASSSEFADASLDDLI